MRINLNASEPSVQPVRPLSRDAIEFQALSFVRQIHPELLTVPAIFPVDDCYEFEVPRVSLTTGPLITAVDDDLPVGIEGVADPTTNTIIIAEWVYERMKAGDGRARFTVAHEIYHGLYHIPQLRRKLIDKVLPNLQRASTVPKYRQPDWQADVFAAALLMPEPAARIVLKQVGPDAHEWARIFGVSLTAASIRVNQLMKLPGGQAK